MTDLKPGWLREDVERANARIQELEGGARPGSCQVRIKEPAYIHHDDPEAPRWVADTVVGRFVYGRDNTGQCYIQVPSGERDVDNMESAKAEAFAEFSAEIRKHPVMQFIDDASGHVADDVVDGEVVASTGEVRVCYGKVAGYAEDQLVYAWGEGAAKADANLVLHALTSQHYIPLSHEWDASLVEELKQRGYDLSTLRFSVMKKPASGEDTLAG